MEHYYTLTSRTKREIIKKKVMPNTTQTVRENPGVQDVASKFAVNDQLLELEVGKKPDAITNEKSRLAAELVAAEERVAELRQAFDAVAKKEGLKAELAEQIEIAEEIRAELAPVEARITELKKLVGEETKPIKEMGPVSDLKKPAGDFDTYQAKKRVDAIAEFDEDPKARLAQLMESLRNNKPQPVVEPKPVVEEKVAAPAPLPDNDLKERIITVPPVEAWADSDVDHTVDADPAFKFRVKNGARMIRTLDTSSASIN